MNYHIREFPKYRIFFWLCAQTVVCITFFYTRDSCRATYVDAPHKREVCAASYWKERENPAVFALNISARMSIRTAKRTCTKSGNAGRHQVGMIGRRRSGRPQVSKYASMAVWSMNQAEWAYHRKNCESMAGSKIGEDIGLGKQRVNLWDEAEGRWSVFRLNSCLDQQAGIVLNNILWWSLEGWGMAVKRNITGRELLRSLRDWKQAWSETPAEPKPFEAHCYILCTLGV